MNKITRSARALSILCLILIISIRVSAQQNQDTQFLQENLKKAKGMKNGGIVLTAIGGVITIVGLVKMEQSFELFTAEQSAGYKSGQVTAVVGGVFAGAGIPLLIVGAKNQRKYSRELNTLSVRFNSNPQNRGLTLTYRF